MKGLTTVITGRLAASGPAWKDNWLSTMPAARDTSSA